MYFYFAGGEKKRCVFAIGGVIIIIMMMNPQEEKVSEEMLARVEEELIDEEKARGGKAAAAEESAFMCAHCARLGSTRSKNTFTMCEVKKHSSPSDCWIVSDGSVFHVGNFLKRHPGGAKSILRRSRQGADCSMDWVPLQLCEADVESDEDRKVGGVRSQEGGIVHDMLILRRIVAPRSRSFYFSPLLVVVARIVLLFNLICKRKVYM